MSEDDDRTPAFQKPSFTCPHCDAFSEQIWHPLQFQLAASSWAGSYLWQARCTVCNKISYWMTGPSPAHTMIWPTSFGGPPASDDMPEDVEAIYSEARSIMNLSPRASSALMRLALEALLADLYPEAGNLNATIGAAAKAGLSEHLIKAMDVLRFNGNEAIHEINREDTPETAASLARILNMVIERLITEPKQIAELHAQMPPGVLTQIEQRDGKA